MLQVFFMLWYHRPTLCGHCGSTYLGLYFNLSVLPQIWVWQLVAGSNVALALLWTDVRVRRAW